VTSAAQIQAAARQAGSLDIQPRGPGALRRPQRPRRAGKASGGQPLRHLRRDPGLPAAADPARGAAVNVLSVTALAALPFIPAYSISSGAAKALQHQYAALVGAEPAASYGPAEAGGARGLDATTRLP
jgi:hypothetical protein